MCVHVAAGGVAGMLQAGRRQQQQHREAACVLLLLYSSLLVALLPQGARYLDFAREPSGHCEVATIHLSYGLPGEVPAAANSQTQQQPRPAVQQLLRRFGGFCCL